ncbi:hypothetical protein BV20DRAFT_972260 [Pilatotrama ljubarskyi]|nr:hypothetical protein BV20DRAFT_972260 [Pilatotrama ljubarskyi]
MAHMHFSWTDSLQAALSSCMPCLKSSDTPSDTEDENPRARPGRGLNGALAHVVIPPPRARPDELEGLLADASDDAETLSLHSNIGSDRRRTGKGRGKGKKKRWADGAPKHIRVFGYDLFGRPPAIQLPESDHEDEGADGGGRRRPRTISTDTLDSDAAPLDAAAIQELSAARHAEALAREEEERRAKEERRRRRREKRELKRAAMARALELQANGNEEFEGFQGSGPTYGLTEPFSPSLGSGSGSMSVSDSQDFGPFAQGQVSQPFDPDAALAAQDAAEAEADGADFGAESYTGRPRKSKSSRSGGGGTQTTSDTRSSSGTGSNSYSYSFAPGGAGLSGVAPYNHQFLAQHQPMPRSPLSPLSPESQGAPPSPAPTASSNGMKKHRRKSTRPKSQSVSVSSASQTASSLVSPPASDAGPGPSPRVFAPGHGHGQSLSVAVRPNAEDFEGFPGDFGVHELQTGAPLPSGGAQGESEERTKEHLPVASFPSVGLRGVQRTKSDMGVFLARRGDE